MRRTRPMLRVCNMWRMLRVLRVCNMRARVAHVARAPRVQRVARVAHARACGACCACATCATRCTRSRVCNMLHMCNMLNLSTTVIRGRPGTSSLTAYPRVRARGRARGRELLRRNFYSSASVPGQRRGFQWPHGLWCARAGARARIRVRTRSFLELLLELLLEDLALFSWDREPQRRLWRNRQRLLQPFSQSLVFWRVIRGECGTGQSTGSQCR